MKKLQPDEKFIINTQFINFFFPDWIHTKKDKNKEWMFYKEYKNVAVDFTFFKSDEFLSFKKVYVLFPYKYLQFDIYETSKLDELGDYLLSDEVLNDFIDIYIVSFDFRYCIKYQKAEHQNRDLFLQVVG